MAEHTPTPWEYRPDEYDDWGWIRAGRIDDWAPLVAVAKGGSWQTAKTLDDHRRDKTDPYEANGLFIVKACNSHDALVKALEDIVNAAALAGVRGIVAGWNGENRPDGPFQRHPDKLGATMKTTCGAMYALDEALQQPRRLVAGMQ